MKQLLSATILASFLIGCGGGGGGGGGGQASADPINAVPTANAGADQSVDEQTTVTLAGSGIDNDGSITSYVWSQTGGTLVTLTNDNAATVSFTAPTLSALETLTFLLTVTDNEGGVATDSVSVIVNPVSISISGIIHAASGTFVDTDVNDPVAPYQDNSNPQDTQKIPNPAIVGGYASAVGTGYSEDRFGAEGDIYDGYEVFLTEGQTVSLTIADYDPQNSSYADLDLWLYPASDTSMPVDDSLSLSEMELVTAPYSGNFHVVVEAYSGLSNYVLTVGQSPLVSAPSKLQISSHDDFIAGELIVELNEVINVEKNGANRPSQQVAIDRFAAMGMSTKAGQVGRPVLVGLGDKQQRQATLATLQAASSPVNIDFWGYGEKQEKIDTIRISKALQAQSDIKAVSLNYLRKAKAVPNDTYYPAQWHYPQINLPQAWDVTTGNDVIVAVVDTGVYMTHPDLISNLTSTGYDFISSIHMGNDGDGIDSNPDDSGDGIGEGSSSYHGTHVAGTIAAATNNGIGVAGVAWNAKVMPIRVLGKGGGTAYDIIQGIRYASGLDNDSGLFPSPTADIINLSLGGPGYSEVAQSTIDEVRSTGVIIIAAAGNESTDAPSYPAAYDGVVSVSAVRFDKSLSNYSNFGTTIDIAAPGGDAAIDQNADGFPDGVLSTVADDSSGSPNPGFNFYQGTSMAAPHVAGVAALMKSVNSALSPEGFDTAIASGQITEDLVDDGATARNNQFGYGLIDGLKAVEYATDLESGAPLPAILAIDQASLNFGTALTNQNINIRNGGAGSLHINAVTTDTSWLNVITDVVDSNNLGSYQVTVDRAGLSAGVYRANILISSDSAGTLSVPVILGVGGTITTSADVGYQWVLLIDAETFETFDSIGVQATEGRYEFEFSDVLAGDYYLLSGTDSDNDYYICDAGESCGGYPLPTDLEKLTIVDGVSGIEFTSTFAVEFSTQSIQDSEPTGVRRVSSTKHVSR